MKTTEESYIEYICCNCKNKDKDLCCIKRKIDNTLYCESYVKDKELGGYKQALYRTANYEHCIMPKLISDWSVI